MSKSTVANWSHEGYCHEKNKDAREAWWLFGLGRDLWCGSQLAFHMYVQMCIYIHPYMYIVTVTTFRGSIKTSLRFRMLKGPDFVRFPDVQTFGGLRGRCAEVV